MYDICVFNGRMRPVTGPHLTNIRAGLSNAQYVFVFVGSVNEPINFRNPFTYEQVCQMIRASLSPIENDRVFIFGVEDRDSDLAWVREVQRLTNEQATRLSFDEPKIALVGCQKDGSSYYLQLFPQWGSVAVQPIGTDHLFSATQIRNALYEADDPAAVLEHHRHYGYLTQGAYLFLRQWVASEDFARMQAEFKFMVEYLTQFQRNPYTDEPQQFVAADMCVMQAGAVLLVRRGQMPGEGLWALPGGHKRAWQTFRDAALDEVGQETGIFDLNPDITRDFLNLCIRGEKLLDNPWRSTREVTISYAFGALLPGTDRPAVKGMDDAREARWWNLDEVTRPMLFEDHFNVIDDFAGRFKNIVL